ncbi:hypothetical protein NN561_002128 [Cricetulus griseus]
MYSPPHPRPAAVVLPSLLQTPLPGASLAPELTRDPDARGALRGAFLRSPLGNRRPVSDAGRKAGLHRLGQAQGDPSGLETGVVSSLLSGGLTTARGHVPG